MAEYPQMQTAWNPYSGMPNWGNNIPAPFQTILQVQPGQETLRSAALKKLRESLSGPYSEAAQTNLISRGADATAGAEGVMQDRIREDAAARGLNPTDPGVQAAQREALAARQAANQGLASDVRNRATEANYQGGLSTARTILSVTKPDAAPVVRPGGLRRSGYGGIDLSPRNLLAQPAAAPAAAPAAPKPNAPRLTRETSRVWGIPGF